MAETDYSAYREGAGSGAEELISNPSSPFLVSLPMTSGDDGDGALGGLDSYSGEGPTARVLD